MGLQEGLLLLGAAVFLLILLDALRRKRAAARRAETQDDEDPDEQRKREELARELPGLNDPEVARAREDLDPLFDDIDVFDDDPIPVLRKSVQLDPGVADLDPDPAETTPMSVEEVRMLFERDPEFDAEAKRSAQAYQQEIEEYQEALPEVEEAANEALDPADVDDLVDIEPPFTTAAPSQASSSGEEDELVQAAQPTEEDTSPVATSDPKEESLRSSLLVNLEQLAWGKAEEFLTININAPQNHAFEGPKLAYVMDAIGMQLSSSGFFHYVEESQGKPVLGYSLVNMFSPGTFDKDKMDEFSSLGIVLVMALPSTDHPQLIFNRMLETARVFERNWGAELQDEQRSNLTQQTIEHYRQRIQDFERKTRLKAIKARKEA
ncbi:cell division protein ZipA C-terminal FtsZ-binding domain-containing protein [Marinospirillum perlucidum]|uniref:cell division protein ZipA C-terminal FtsZ-binding domain-containing protein n=1 Tax=Marinospirillum perlucidum TaxID=1982602 RepID=UPI000DF3EA16|nr:cell division protein ZipA C-terminal FtsZ-binding domain-containing protein [Marinospirillum perlucidum]